MDDDVSLSMIAAASKCSHLRIFKLGLEGLSERTDLALAECVRNNTKLEVIELFFGAGRVRFDALCEAIQECVSLKYFKLCGCAGTKVRLDSNVRQYMDAYLRLNRAGRSRSKEDPTNVRVAVDFLAKVSNHLDCLFILLRESMLLFDTRSGARTSQRKRKRT